MEDRETSPYVKGAAFDQAVFRVEGGLIDERSVNDPRFVARSYRFIVTIPVALEVGPFAHQILLLENDDKPIPWLTVPIRGIVTPIVRAIPASIRFGKPKTGSKSAIKLMIVSEDQSRVLEAKCVAHDSRTTIRMVRREDDRIFFEVDHDGVAEASSIRPIRFQISQPPSAMLDVPVEFAREHSSEDR